MTDDLLERYNYARFIPESFGPWMRFEESPRLGSPAPDFPLWDLDERRTSLHVTLRNHRFTFVEFGSFT